MGALFGVCALLVIGSKVHQSTLADKDLYRFCLYNKIDLPNCKLPPKPLDANEKK